MANRLCLEIGHQWQATNSPTYRVCSRGGCHAAQRLQDDVWIAVTEKVARKRPAGSLSQAALPEK